LPFLGTYVISPKFSTTLGLGPSLGVDFFKSVSLDADRKIIVSKGSGLSSGYVMQFAVAYNSERFFSGFEYRYRIYGHHFETLDRLEKQYSYYQIYFGWRIKPPGFLKKSLDWANEVSPIKFE
jgi:hypothetical protein